MFNNIRKKESGQGMVEYGLILALISIISAVALGGLGGGIKGTFEKTFEKTIDAIGGNVPAQEEVGSQPVYTDEEIQDLVDNQEYTKVATAEELQNVSLSGKYIQVADIDLSGHGNFVPIGHTDSANSFKGIYDGGGYEIRNLTVDKGGSDYAGLFGRAEGATFKNIGLVDVSVKGGNYVGGLVGGQSSSSVSNSYATGTVKGKGSVGGLVGGQSRSSVSNSYATGSVKGRGNMGGLVGGQLANSSVSNSYATGTVKGTDSRVGGLVGYQVSSSVSNSYATGSVKGRSNIGGLVGYQNSSSEVLNSYYDKETTNQTSSSGGADKSTAEMQDPDTYTDWHLIESP